MSVNFLNVCEELLGYIPAALSSRELVAVIKCSVCFLHYLVLIVSIVGWVYLKIPWVEPWVVYVSIKMVLLFRECFGMGYL